MKTTTIKQGCMIAARPQQIYDVWMTSARHAQLTGGEARISPKVGGSFTTFDGWATGTNLELIPAQRIVQTWRGSDWPADHLSTLTLTLKATTGGTKLMFSQTSVPTTVAKDVAQGWRDYYWTPLKALFAGRQSKKA